MPILSLHRIWKRFGPVQALRGVDLAVGAGEIHALLGENGAGKSTLMRIAYGLEQPDAGEILVDGTPRRFKDAFEARKSGIGMVHQHFTSIPAFTVSENVALVAGWRGSASSIRARVIERIEATGLELDPDAPARSLSAERMQGLEVLKALAGSARVLLLDEPTAVLAPPEAEALFSRVRALRDAGVASILITHKLTEALEHADRITVLRHGQVAFHARNERLSATELAAAMLGEAPASHTSRLRARASRPEPSAKPLVLVRDLEIAPLLGGPGLKQGELRLEPGEIVAVAAVEGNGQRELLRAIAGLVRPRGGLLTISGKVGFIPEDRTSEGMIPLFTLTENLVLALGRGGHWVSGPWIDWPAARRRTGELIDSFEVQAHGPDAPAASLSGGNQQRLVVGTALEPRPDILVAENPTRGLDLKATAAVHERLRQAASTGVGVLVHSSDLDELLELADRVAVVSGGTITEFPPGTERDRIGRAMLGRGGAG